MSKDIFIILVYIIFIMIILLYVYNYIYNKKVLVFENNEMVSKDVKDIDTNFSLMKVMMSMVNIIPLFRKYMF